MSEMVARCRSCGFEDAAEFAHCPVCHGESGWWCLACREWRPTRACPACATPLAVPAEVSLGSFPAGSRVRMGCSSIRQKAITGAPVRSDPNTGKAWA